MTPQDLPAFIALLRPVARLKQRELGEDDYLLYFGALVEHDLDTVKAAIMAAVKRCTFMPQPDEILALIEGDVDDQAALAWARVLVAARRGAGWDRPVSFDDPVIHAAIEGLGGWREIHSLALFAAEDVQLASKRKEFLALYGAYRRRGVPPSHAPADFALDRSIATGPPLVLTGDSVPPPLSLPAAPAQAALPPARPMERLEDYGGKLRALIADLAARKEAPPPLRRHAWADPPQCEIGTPLSTEEIAHHEACRARARRLADLRRDGPCDIDQSIADEEGTS